MRITPLDVQSHRFARRLSGFDPEEVQAFLRMVAEDYESLLRENAALSDRLRALEKRIQELSAEERLLKETLVSAQQLSEEMQQTAVRESEALLSGAEVRAEKILDAAHRRAARLGDDIRHMRELRSRLASSLRATIQTHLSLIDTIEQDEGDDPLADGKVAFLRTSAARAGAARGEGGD